MNEKTLLWILGGALLGAAGYLGYTYFQSTKPQPDTTQPVQPGIMPVYPGITPGYQEWRAGERDIPVGVEAPLTDIEKGILDQSEMWTVPTES